VEERQERIDVAGEGGRLSLVGDNEQVISDGEETLKFTILA